MRALVLLLLLAGIGSSAAFLQPLLGASSPVQRRRSIGSSSFLSAQATAKEFSSLTVIQLKDLLREKGFKTSGRKSELILRLEESSSSGEDLSQQDVAPVTAAPEKTPQKKKPVDSAAAVASKKDDKRSNNNSNSFQELNCGARLVQRLSDMGMTTPTPIQREAIPKAMTGRDVMGLAQTGTGKTLAFGVPLVAQLLLQNNNKSSRSNVRGLVLAPTRELANQIAVQLRELTEGTPIGTMVVVGGKNIKTQINKLRAGNTDLLVATPGRLIDLMDRKALSLKDTQFLVLDEADMMLDMGFLPSLRKIVKMLPRERQTMLFSATMSKSMNEVAGTYLKNPVRVEVARAGKTADKVTQQLHYVARPDKVDLLIKLLGKQQQQQHDTKDRALVFGRTKHGMEKLSKKLLKAGFQAGSIHGNKSQPQRDKAIAAFKSGDISVLVATDVAARGLDIPDVKYVYNYELPNVPEAYVHRIGRTARAGKEGAAVAFCSMEEMDDLDAIQKVTGASIPVVSGTPWSRAEARDAKNAIKETKQRNQQIQTEARKPKKIKEQQQRNHQPKSPQKKTKASSRGQARR